MPLQRLAHKRHCSFLLAIFFFLDHSLWGKPASVSWENPKSPNKKRMVRNWGLQTTAKCAIIEGSSSLRQTFKWPQPSQKFHCNLVRDTEPETPSKPVLNCWPTENEITNTCSKLLLLVDRVPEELWVEGRDIIQEVVIKTIPKKEKCKKAKWLSEEALQTAEKTREAKRKGEKGRYTHLNAKFQRIARSDKKAFLSDQCKETEENNRKGKTRDLFKKIRDTKETFHAKMGTIKDRNGMDLTEAEDIKKRWQKYTEELYKKDLHDPDNHDGMIAHLEPDILECEVKWCRSPAPAARDSTWIDKRCPRVMRQPLSFILDCLFISSLRFSFILLQKL